MTNLIRESQTMGVYPALIVVDIINGFTDPDCQLGGNYPDVLEANKRLANVFRDAKFPIFFTTVIYQSHKQARVFRDRLPALNVLNPDSKWINIHPALNRQEDELIITKHWASAFFKTTLYKTLQDSGVDSLVVTGLTTSGCVRATVVDGLQHNYKVFVPRQAVGDRNMDAHKANLTDMHAKYADVMDIHTIIELVKGHSNDP